MSVSAQVNAPLAIVTFNIEDVKKAIKGPRSLYQWDEIGVKQGYTVSGEDYYSAQQSMSNFVAKNPHDPEQQKKIDAHLRGVKRAAVNAKRKEVEAAGKEWSDDLWTEEDEANVKPDPDFVITHTRRFMTEAVRDDNNKPIKTKGIKRGKQTLADNYNIIRIN